MDIDLDDESGSSIHNFALIPDGDYVCIVREVRPGTTRNGDVRWSMDLVVAEGEHIGKHAAWDSIVFSSRGRVRARSILSAFGLPHSGRVTIEPKDLEGRKAIVTIRKCTYVSGDAEVSRCEVPYEGYKSIVG